MSFGVADSSFASTERMRITNIGRVGIGITTDSVKAKLHVKTDTWEGVTPSLMSDYTTALFEATDSVVQVAGRRTSGSNKHVGSVVLTSRPDSGNEQHWLVSQRGPDESGSMADGLIIGYKSDSSGVSGTALNDYSSTAFLNFATNGYIGLRDEFSDRRAPHFGRRDHRGFVPDLRRHVARLFDGHLLGNPLARWRRHSILGGMLVSVPRPRTSVCT